MLVHAAVLSLGLSLSLVSAQGSGSAYIPSSGISSSCTTFLLALDNNAQLATCSSNLLTATQLFSPSSTSSSSSSSSAISTALSSLCSGSANTQCPDALIKQTLTYFTGNCTSADMANNLVRSNYDVLYVLSPFTDAICTKDPAKGEYCALEIGESSSTSSSNTTTTGPSGAQQLTVQTPYTPPHIELADLYISMKHAAKRAIHMAKRALSHTDNARAHHQLVARQANSTSSSTLAAQSDNSDNDSTALLPNATTFRSSNLPFLFLSGDMTSSQLCTPCTKEVLAAYVSFENDYPYANGLPNSPILGGQVALWKDIGATCGSGFLSAITAQSGAGTSISAARPTAAAAAFSTVAATFGLATLAGLVLMA